MHQMHIRSDCPKCLIMLLRTCTWSLLSCDIEEHLVTDLPHGLLFNNEWSCYMSDHWISCGGCTTAGVCAITSLTCFLHVHPAQVSMWPCDDILFSSILRILYSSWLSICWSLYALVWYWPILISHFISDCIDFSYCDQYIHMSWYVTPLAGVTSHDSIIQQDRGLVYVVFSLARFAIRH